MWVYSSVLTDFLRSPLSLKKWSNAPSKQFFAVSSENTDAFSEKKKPVDTKRLIFDKQCYIDCLILRTRNPHFRWKQDYEWFGWFMRFFIKWESTFIWQNSFLVRKSSHKKTNDSTKSFFKSFLMFIFLQKFRGILRNLGWLEFFQIFPILL